MKQLNKSLLTTFMVIIIILLGVSKSISQVTDYDGNVYKTVTIGTQEWTSENLNVEHYRNGDIIPLVQDKDEWGKLKTGAWCYYENDPEKGKTYGKMYNWYALNDSRGLAPEGWHIPNEVEWKKLLDFLGGDKVAGDKLKSTKLWNSTYKEVTNESGFTALPGGYRNISGYFHDVGSFGFFWSSEVFTDTYAFFRNLYYGYSMVHLEIGEGKRGGCSVRCIKDNPNQTNNSKLNFLVKDVDGNKYESVTIGNQEWMAENLNVEHYRNGDPIPQIKDKHQWIKQTSGAWCYYENETKNGKTFGKLYNWYAVNDPRGLAPKGWHIPSDSEWALPTDYGFFALFSGWRDWLDFSGLNTFGCFWTSTADKNGNDLAFHLTYYNNNSKPETPKSFKYYGMSIRCVKD